MNEREREELGKFAQDLLTYRRRYEMHVATVTDPASSDYPDRLISRGLIYWSARRMSGLSRRQVAKGLGVEVVQLAAFEGGLISSADLPDRFVENLEGILRTKLESRWKKFDSMPS